ncbi:hypothetical protein BKA63DRAFT_559750 [Paraphoma chrysanthemicola]|nr:hypothetical protein BKA63DRAFT_559750 [Paraphoma chrysanthemicola]
MVKLYLAYTAPINPPNASPVLTEPQIWAGLQHKIRFAQDFVPIIESCTVLSDENGVVVRDVKFKDGAGPISRAKETVRSFWPSWVDFVQEDGSVIKNIVSDGPGGGVEDLQMTYAFEFNLPKIEEGSAEASAELKRLKGMSKMAVEKSIDTIRQMVIDGRIKE